MSSAVRPSFWNDQPQRFPFDGAGTVTSTSTELRSAFVPRTTRYSASGSLRRPLALATTTNASSTNNGVTPAFDWDSGFPQNYVRPPNLIPTVANSSAVAMIGAKDGRPPHFQNWSLGVQRRLAANLVLEADYVGVKGTRLGTALIRPNELNPSYLNLGSLLTSSATSAAAQAAGIPLPYPGFTGSVAQALRPFPQYLDITNLSNPNGNSTYHALQMKMERRIFYVLTGVAAYAWSKTLTNSDIAAGGGPGGQTFYNRGLEKAVSEMLALMKKLIKPSDTPCFF